jgi:hypothetical protein
VLLVTKDFNVLYVDRGVYGGWVVKQKLEQDSILFAVWCFKRESRDLNLDSLLHNEVVEKFVEELKSLGVSLPRAREVVYYYKLANVSVKKVSEDKNYTVVDVTPTGTVVTAKAAHLYWCTSYSRKGNCYGDLCSGRDKVVLLAKQYKLDIYEAEVGKRSYETRIKIVTDTADLEKLLEQVLKQEAEAEREEAEEVAEEEASELEEAQEQIRIEIPEVKPKELELELPTTTSTVPTAVATAVPQRQQLVRIYLLSMRLPSKYLLQKVVVNENEEVRKWEGLAASVASRDRGD